VIAYIAKAKPEVGTSTPNVAPRSSSSVSLL
jgi:hypothetical protein